MNIKKSNSQTFIILFFIFSLVLFILPSSYASTMIIEVLPSQPTGGQNFTISVYDPNITDDTPYLTNVQLKFLNNTYFITDDLENRELQLSSPTVHYPTTFTIQASKEDYNTTNTTITILPASTLPPHLVITLIEDQSLTADAIFTIKVTDEYNTPIQNATVSIKNIQTAQSDGLTNQTGYITLKAPNQQEITILAQKEGYQDDSFDIWIETKQDTTTTLLSHPMTPVLIAFCILIGSIIFVTLKNNKQIIKKTVRKQTKSTSKKNSLAIENVSKSQQTKPESISSAQKKSIDKSIDYSPKIEEIHIKKYKPEQKIMHVESKDTKKPDSSQLHSSHKHTEHQWFNSSDSVESQVDQILLENNSKTKKNDWFEGTESLRNVIDSTIKQKQKKKKTSQQQ